jgi:hypothetical protein
MATLEEDVSPSPQKGKGGALSQLSDTPLRPHALKLDSLSYDTPPKAGPDGTFSPRMWARALAEVYTAGARESIGLQVSASIFSANKLNVNWEAEECACYLE